MSTELALVKDSSLVKVDEKTLTLITNHHKKVSDIKTPKPFVKQKMGMDYVQYSYMRDIAYKYYPDWSWEIKSTEFAGDKYYVVVGRLIWTEQGVIKHGDASAAHRIQKQRDNDDYVDLGNDVKAANTDCIKKAFNMYMNICDDVYRNQVEDPELTDKQRKDINVTASKLKDKDKKKKIMEQIEDGVINAFNYKASMAKLERLVNE